MRKAKGEKLKNEGEGQTQGEGDKFMEELRSRALTLEEEKSTPKSLLSFSIPSSLSSPKLSQIFFSRSTLKSPPILLVHTPFLGR